MRLRQLASRFSSVSKLWGSIAPEGVRQTPRPRRKLRVETLETRNLMAFNIALQGNVLTVTNDGNRELADFIFANGNFVFQSNGANITGLGTPAQNLPGYSFARSVPAAGIARIDFIASPGAVFDVTIGNPEAPSGSLAGAPNLRQVTYQGSNATDRSETVNFALAANPNLYYRVNMNRGADDRVLTPDVGVFVLEFTDQTNPNSQLTLTPTNGGTARNIALDFSAVTTNVQANLNATGGLLASYGNVAVMLGAGRDAANVVAVHGGRGDDALTANNNGNLLIGGLGNDVIVGGNEADQLNATFDFSPAIAGALVAAPVGFQVAHPLLAEEVAPKGIVDISNFAAISNDNRGAVLETFRGTGGEASAALYTAFGKFNFGRGAAFVRDTHDITPEKLLDDFKAANSLTGLGALTVDVLVGKAGNDGIYGFNNTDVKGFGGEGVDVFSTNALANRGTYDGGAGDDYFAIASLQAFLNASEDTDEIVGLPDDPSNVVIVNGATRKPNFRRAKVSQV